jgi:putative transcriptional regulator
MTAAEFVQARRVARVKTVRTTLGLSQEAFAARYLIPIGTLRDWEQGRAAPDAPARAYIQVIAGDPEGVIKALEKRPKRPA